MQSCPVTRRHALCALLASLVLTPAYAREQKKPELLVFAAASLTDVLGELSKSFEAVPGGVPVKVSFASSSVLARQVEAGGRADVFISADQEWMDYLQSRNLVDRATRRDLVRNRLVLIAPADSAVRLTIARGFDIAAALGKGRLATGDPDTVPVGRYARNALKSLAVWDEVADRLVRAENVRAALTYVARGETPLGIVYATDAQAEKRVRIVDTFPANTHPPITYPAAALNSARPEAAAYLTYIASPAAATTWKKYGFLELGR